MKGEPFFMSLYKEELLYRRKNNIKFRSVSPNGRSVSPNGRSVSPNGHSKTRNGDFNCFYE